MQINSSITRSSSSIAAENARFMSGVYKWMTLGLLVTGVLAYYVSSSPELLAALVMNKIVFFGLIIAQFGTVVYLSRAIQNISGMTATLVYLLYAALTGVTFSVIILAYTQESIQNAFFLTSFAFAGLSAFGYFTKIDLGPIGTFCVMGVWGLVGFALLSFFVPSMMNGTMSMIYNIFGLIIFSGLTAYDTQKIKATNIIGNEGSDEDHKETISGALRLYMDFINLFLFILRMSGSRRK
jgi:FtsH-binding integral membrane protein